MNRIENGFKLRMQCLTEDRVFTDEFLLNLYDYIEDNIDMGRYMDILNTEFRGDIPQKFIEVLSK